MSYSFFFFHCLMISSVCAHCVSVCTSILLVYINIYYIYFATKTRNQCTHTHSYT
ncbi:hypothetical protein E2C01_011815 [Portunus trituberculatus]|uniref:Uncharacterized protein n=1 Tax=Portunus trituberculatus TaxID=210409 RepID=A0A5B7DCV1_PORTR|nr:hypothetical protein [Portunus trituberculatus]